MNETDQMLATATTAVLTEDDTLTALELDDLMSTPPATTYPGGKQYGKSEFFDGFFSGPCQHSRRGTGNDALDAVAVRTAILNYAGENPAGLTNDADPRPSGPADRQWNEKFFAGFWRGPRQHRRRMSV